MSDKHPGGRPSKYKPEYVKTVEILLHYKSEDSSENWYLEAYDWASSTFSNIGFNSTEIKSKQGGGGDNNE